MYDRVMKAQAEKPRGRGVIELQEEGLPRSARQLFSGKRVAELMVRKLGVGESEWRSLR